ncbi:MAG TPA: triphosphoribosyl-dephospho-CoA synthase CitG [Erysipelothrix sp.]
MNRKKIVDLAIKSLIHEVSLYPKPGLVDPIDAGSHDDMDYYTFIDSCFALSDGFNHYYKTGEQHQGDLPALFKKIRIVGMQNEKAMFAATQEINTHKGANFMFGIIISLIAHLNNPNLHHLQEAIKIMTSGLVENELESLTEFKTHGEIMFEKYGYTGIRGEVESGIPHAFDIALPKIKEAHHYQLGLKQALLALIAHNNDSNMLKRGGIEGLKLGQQLAQQPYVDINLHLNNMNQKFKEKNLSPGGSADLLAVAIFLYLYERELEKTSEQ